LEIIPLLPLTMSFIHLTNFYSSIQPGIYWNLVLFLVVASISCQGIAHILTILCHGQIALQILLSIVGFLFFAMIGNIYLVYSRLHYLYQFVCQFSVPHFIYEATILL